MSATSRNLHSARSLKTRMGLGRVDTGKGGVREEARLFPQRADIHALHGRMDDEHHAVKMSSTSVCEWPIHTAASRWSRSGLPVFG
jgi:hypothetical protein